VPTKLRLTYIKGQSLEVSRLTQIAVYASNLRSAQAADAEG
jgi:hypothetical protein